MMKKLGFMFPGQGSQSLGMLRDLAERHAVVTTTYAAASDVLGYDLWNLVQQGPVEQLNQTEYTQPALLAADVAVWQVWLQQNEILPAFMAGHSLGEYAALVCANALDFNTAIQLVAYRGQCMQQAVPGDQGAMAAIIGLDDEAVGILCIEAAQGDVVEPANFNSTGQVVIAGHKEAVERAMALAKVAGARMVLPLPVSVPSHCALMRPAAERFAAKLQEITLQSPEIPVINNVDVAVYTDPDAIKDALVRQLYSPVRWVETMRAMVDQKIESLVECGPGKVLAGLAKRTIPDLAVINI